MLSLFNQWAEATWGADPLELLGGFRAHEYDANATFHSSLSPKGLVSWSQQKVHNCRSDPNATEVALTINFPNIDWQFLQSIYGWAALQYQAWARGNLTVKSKTSQCIVLHIDNVLEYWVDSNHYFGGDCYAYRRAPLVLRLDSGIHQIDIRLIRDVRLMGGVGEPTVSLKLKAELSLGGLAVTGSQMLAPDMVQGRLASSFASVPVRNDGQSWISISNIASVGVRKAVVWFSNSC